MKITASEFPENFKGLVLIPFVEKENDTESSLTFMGQSVSTKLFSAKKDSVFIVENQLEERVYFLIGLGKNPDYKSVKTAFRRITAKHENLFEDKAALFSGEDMSASLLEAAISGLLLGTYRLGHYKSKETPVKDFSKTKLMVSTPIDGAKSILKKSEKIAAAQLETFLMVDLPSNKVTPTYLAAWAKKSGKEFGFDVQVLDRKKAEKENLHAFLAVAQGSEKEPQFIIMNYEGKKASKHYGLVGKGVTFDTGGLNIKTAGMVHMKCDMGGAATVLGAMQLIADLQLPIKVTAIVPCVENAVDKDAFLPSDVIQSYSGKTIEIIDTDAEGRLILADGLSYLVKNYKPDTIIDFATLTGSAVGTFGFECAALFSNDADLSLQFQDCGEGIGERVWPLPLWDVYKSEMDSEIADIRNYHGKPYAGAITAAKFLECFIENHPSWAHIDIAGTAFGDSEFAKTKHATAFGVHLLLKLFEKN